ncbi:MAG: stage sporulation protein, partial [Actinomycetota bacterium]|nr:stage sporulation protein [Actinomycetota bacterium]
PAHAAVPVVVVNGRGHGHGVGMAQDGAFFMGAHGASMTDILGHFYPGTALGSAKGDLRVVVLVSGDDRAVLGFPDDGELRSPRSGPQHPGFPLHIAAGDVATITFDGAYHVERGGTVSAQSATVQQVPFPSSSTTSSSSTTTTRPKSTSTTSTTSFLPTVPPPPTSSTTTPKPPSGPSSTTTTTRPPSGGGPSSHAVTSPEPIWAGPTRAGGTVSVPARNLRYRGELEVSAATGPLRVVNQIDVEQYLWGLGEVSSRWSPPALRAQIVAARTYAMRAMAANGEICDTQRCQAYRGASGEYAQQVDAVNATLGSILSFGGHYASAVFSANAAGVSATPEEGFGTSNASHPYLVATPYQSDSNVTFEVRIALADLARRLGYPGNATSFSIQSKGPSGRPLEVQIDGDRGPLRVRALAADAAMGLRSTMWDARVETADAAPAAPDAQLLIQAPPEDVGTAIAQEQAAAEKRHDRRVARAAGTTTTTPSSTPGRDGSHGAVPWLLVLLVLAAGAGGGWVLRTARGPEGSSG